MAMDRETAKATVIGIALDFAGQTVGWWIRIGSLWVAIAVAIGSVKMVEQISEWIR